VEKKKNSAWTAAVARQGIGGDGREARELKNFVRQLSCKAVDPVSPARVSSGQRQICGELRTMCQ